MPNNIVWVEDDGSLMDPVVKPLELAGHKILRVRSVKEALDSVEKIRDADLLLLDLFLPLGPLPGEVSGLYGDYTGIDLLYTLRHDYTVVTPVVALTVVRDEEQLDRLKGLGHVREIVNKPVLPSVLKSKVESALHTP